MLESVRRKSAKIRQTSCLLSGRYWADFYPPL